MNKEYNFTCALFFQPLHSWSGEGLQVGSQDPFFSSSALVSPIKRREEGAWYLTRYEPLIILWSVRMWKKCKHLKTI